MQSENTYEVVIVGGSYAGLSAAMALGRSIRKVLIIDSGNPCNQSTPASHNFITQDGNKPADISKVALEQVLAYPTVQFMQDWVEDITGENMNFEVSTQKNGRFFAQKVIFASGVKDLMPEIPGVKDCWGISVIHCPYCHGYEVRGKVTGILTNDPMTNHFAKLILNWTPHLTIFTHGPAQFDTAELAALHVPVIETDVQDLVHEQGYLSEIHLADASVYGLDALYYRPQFVQHSDIPAKLGCELTEQGHIVVDASQKTTVPGIFAAGDCTTMFRTVSTAVAGGTMAGAMANMDLIFG